MQTADLRAQSAAFEATIRRALRAEPGLSVDPDDDAMDTAWVTWGPLDGNGYRINGAILPGGVGREWGAEPHAFISAAYLDGTRSERMICLVDVHANDVADGTALAERLLNALRADRDRPRCPECEGAGSFPAADGSLAECEACGGPGFVGRREEFIDYRPDPYDADDDPQGIDFIPVGPLERIEGLPTATFEVDLRTGRVRAVGGPDEASADPR